MMAAGGATGGRQETGTSRQQRRAWARISSDRLVQRLTAKVEELSAGLDAALEALDAVAECDGLADRLAACAPALVALLAGRSPTALQRLRRNVAMHAARVPGNLSSAPAAALRQAAKGPRLGAVVAADRAGKDVESDFKVEICVDELGTARKRSAVPREVPNSGADVHALMGWLAADDASTLEKQVVGQFDLECEEDGHVLMPLAPGMWLPPETLPHAVAFVEGLEAGWRLAERRAAAGGMEDVDASYGEANEDDDDELQVQEEIDVQSFRAPAGDDCPAAGAKAPAGGTPSAWGPPLERWQTRGPREVVATTASGDGAGECVAGGLRDGGCEAGARRQLLHGAADGEAGVHRGVEGAAGLEHADAEKMIALRAAVEEENDAAECLRRCQAASVAAARAVVRLQENLAAPPDDAARAAVALDQAVQQERRAEEHHHSRKAHAWEMACAMVHAGVQAEAAVE